MGLVRLWAPAMLSAGANSVYALARWSYIGGGLKSKIGRSWSLGGSEDGYRIVEW